MSNDTGTPAFNAKSYATTMRHAALLIIEAAETLERLTSKGLEVTAMEAMLLNAGGEHVAAAGSLCEQGTNRIRERLHTQGGRFA